MTCCVSPTIVAGVPLEAESPTGVASYSPFVPPQKHFPVAGGNTLHELPRVFGFLGWNLLALQESVAILKLT